MNPFVMVILLVALMGLIVGGGVGYAFKAYRGGKGWRNIGKTLTITIPEVPGTEAELKWVKTPDGTIERDSKEPGAERGEKDKVILAGPATYPSNWGSLNLVSTYGHNLIAPSKFEAAAQVEKAAVAEWVANYKRLPRPEEAKAGGAFAELLQEAMEEARKLATRFLIWDPRTYHKACQENDMQDLYNSNGPPKDPWYAKMAAVGVIMILGILVLAFMGFGAYVLPMLKAAAAGS